MPCHAGYHKSVAEIEPMNEAVKKSVHWLNTPEYSDVVAIAGKGHSGIPLVAVLSFIKKLHPIYVRDPNSERHDYLDVTTGLPSKKKHPDRYVIVDDFISSGATIRRIIDAIIDHEFFENPYPKAILLHEMTKRHGDTHKLLYGKKTITIPLLNIGNHFSMRGPLTNPDLPLTV